MWNYNLLRERSIEFRTTSYKKDEKRSLLKKNPISPNRIINNSIANELKSDVARLINHHTFKSALHTNQVAASCVNTDF